MESRRLKDAEETIEPFLRTLEPLLCQLPPERFADRSRELLATGRDMYLILKHEDDLGGALDAERLMAMA
ncbi:MAG TPA: hypothetical protein VFH61_16790 [Thermoleophilia bacterium]|nr:hypothetical protein [Thermoleophilia bacterium]